MELLLVIIAALNVKIAVNHPITVQSVKEIEELALVPKIFHIALAKMENMMMVLVFFAKVNFLKLFQDCS